MIFLKNGNQTASYEVLPSVIEGGATPRGGGGGELRHRKIRSNPSTNTNEEKPASTKTSTIGTIMAYVTKQCFIGALVVMMVSWTNFWNSEPVL